MRHLSELNQYAPAHWQRLRIFREQVVVNCLRRLTAFGDGPNYERLAAPHVARGEHTLNGCHVFSVRRDVAALIQLQPQLLDHAVSHRSEKSHRQQNEISFDGEFTSTDGLKFRRRADTHGVNALHVPVLVAFEPNAVDAPFANAALFVTALRTELQRPQRPWSGGCPRLGRLGHDLELLHALRLLPQAGAQDPGCFPGPS